MPEIIRSDARSGIWSTTIADERPVLVAFDLAYSEGDRHVGLIEAGGVTSDGTRLGWENYVLGFRDGDGDAPTRMSTEYWNLHAASPPRSVGGTVRGRANTVVPIGPVAPDELVVLRGFRVQSRGGGHHVRKVAVQFLPSPGAYLVHFADDSPRDDGFDFEVSYFTLPSVERTGPTANPHFLGLFEQRFSFTRAASVAKDTPGTAVIAGFSFEFADSDHHLHSIGLDLSSVRVIRAAFRDGGESHRVDALVQYVIPAAYIW